ncbi:ribokinase [Rugosimonospora africana]|uniref:Ribokinase n=1 Tax=Rugosimonospora africana TaxID=556532 RepID=A0A8J3QS42_9ACTN|nr:ribokinase [Rugosimonospora africana]GIH14872.1 ribokinase [Rugosimonospora africana]
MPEYSRLRAGSVTVLGSLNTDFIVTQPRFPRPGETVQGNGFATMAGGKGLNQAVAAARSGATVRLVGAVGDDTFGRSLVDFVAGEGIDVTGVAVLAATTGSAHIAVTAAGENAIVLVAGANGERLRLDDGVRAAVTDGTYLVTQAELPLPLVTEALAAARERGIVTVLTPSPVSVLGGVVPPGVDILVGNELEVCELADAADPRAAACRLSASVPIVIATLGGDGVVWAIDGAIAGQRPARPVAVVDTTGAGDTFVGALVARLAAGDGLETAVDWAVLAASLSVSRAGAAPSIPTTEEINALLHLGALTEERVRR